jgi:hypothetical protein
MAKEKKPKIKRSLFRKIINVFIGMFLGLMLIILLFMGFSRNKVISIANKELNGKVNIEAIDGTILTSLFLRNTSILVDKDTLFYAHNIEVKTSPLQLLLKKIFIRKILIEDAKIAMLQNSEGAWNMAKLIKPKPEDTTATTFEFIVQANDVQLRNIQFVRQTYQNYKSQKDYSELSFDDLRISKLNFSAEAFADVPNSNYLLILKELSFHPNLTRFSLHDISGQFSVTKQFVNINNFHFKTDSSEIKVDLRLDSVNVFKNANIEHFKNSPVSINIKADPFNFDDLSSFLGSTEILKGNPSMELKAHGKFGGFKIEKLLLDYKDTHFELSGKVLNLNTPGKLYVEAKFSNTSINYENVNALLPTLKLPEYAKLHVKDVNFEFAGEPTNFKSKFIGYIDEGKVSFDATMNVGAKPMTYNIQFETENLNLNPVFNLNTSLNAKGSVAGRGTTPADLVADMKLNIYESVFNDIKVDKFDMTTKAKDKKMELEMDGKSKGASFLLSGNLVYNQDTIPEYSMIGSLKDVDLSKFLNDPNYKSNLNISFSAEGKNFNPDEIVGTFSFGVDSSSFKDKSFGYSSIEGNIKREPHHREILLSSDFVDFKIDGDFSLNKAIDLVMYESKTISQIVTNKLKELNPLAVINREEIKDSVQNVIPPIVNEDLKFDYSFLFKDFKLIAMLMGNDEFDVSGSGKGTVSNLANNFSISSEISLDYLVMMEKERTIYISGLSSDINFTRDNRFISFDKLFGSASITGQRFYSQSSIRSINADIIFNQSKLFFNTSADYEDYLNVDAEGIIKMTPSEQQILVSKLDLSVAETNWSNKDTLRAVFNPNYFKVVDWSINRNDSKISLDGIIESSGKQNFILTASKISGDIFEKMFFGYSDGKLKTDGKFDMKIGGEYHNPIIEITSSINDLNYAGAKLGFIDGNLTYKDKKINTNFVFLDAQRNANKPLLNLNGTIPIDLDFGTVKTRVQENENFQIKLKSSDFNMNQLGNILPWVFDQRGILRADILISGNLDDLNYSGFASLNDAHFKTIYNNLPYKGGVKLRFDKKGIFVDSLIVENDGGSKYSGTVTGSGKLSFDRFKLADVSLRFNGDLAVLGEQTKSVSPFFYGDLLIGTNGDWLLTKQEGRLFFKGDILLKQTDLTYTTGQNINGTSNKDFDFIFVADSSKIDKETVRFNKIISREKTNQTTNYSGFEQKDNFDYDLKISTENNAKLIFILSQVANQKLTVEMSGSLNNSNIKGEARTQGTFELMQGSKLEFLGKAFDATGSLRFESDITNPYLDIVATYTADYINPREENSAPQPVAVKIRIRGPQSDLGKNLTNNSESLGIYMGTRNIQNDVRETRYDYSDALTFIILGKFKDDITVQDRNQMAQTNVISNTATSLLGSVLSNYLNSTIGDLVNNFQISQAGTYTKFSVSGRAKNFSYSIGGTTEAFQNLSKASFGFIYNFNPKLSVRFDRKDPVINFVGLDEKIYELALKYKFEF